MRLTGLLLLSLVGWQLLATGEAFGQTARPDGTRGDARRPDSLKLGDLAPDFSLETLDGKQTITLSDLRGKQPVVLLFGSYT